MENSPLQFARDFERLKSDIAKSPSPETAILALVDFWPNLKEKVSQAAYSTYFDEFLQILSSHLAEKNLGDLTIDELASLTKFLKELPSGAIPERFREPFSSGMNLAAQSYARKLLYVGDYEKALKTLDAETSLTLTAEETEGKNETEILHSLCGKAVEKGEPTSGFLRSVLSELEFAKDDLHQNRVNCLFVEKDSSGNSVRGRLRVLEGNVEPFPKKMPSHEVTFQNQIKVPEDPFVGVAYDALDALKTVFRTRGDKTKAEAQYHAHFSILDSGQFFTGDSIGLAFALLSYAQAVKSDITRHERLLPADIAVTGSIDMTGKILPVNDETLKYKIERAFLSPVKYLILPGENRTSAVTILKELQGRFPHRQMRLIGVGNLSEVVDDRNVVRAERVCPIEFASRLAAKYARYKFVQIPMLLALAYLLVCLIYPKAWIWFDNRIDHIEVIDDRFRSVNAAGHTIFSSEAYGFPLDARLYSKDRTDKLYSVYDANKDGKDELFIVPHGRDSWAVSSTLQYYENDGALKWSRQTYEVTSYPGDSEVRDIGKSLNYTMLTLIPINNNRGEQYIMSVSVASMPARCQFLLFDTAGNKISGPYLHTGHMTNNVFLFSPGIEDRQGRLIVGCVNNRMDRAGLIVIDPFRLEGVSPPFDNELFAMSKMPKGSQLYYMAFPETEISAGSGIRNMIFSIKKNENEYEVAVQEGSNELLSRHNATTKDTLLLPSIVYVLDTNFMPVRAYFPDLCLERLQQCLSALGKELLRDSQKLLQSLLNDVIVYQGDSLVYHPAAGIYPHNSN